MHVPIFAALALAAAIQQPDTSVFPQREALIRMYLDCDESRWPWGLDEAFLAKSDSELVAGIAAMARYEAGWRRWFNQRAGDSIKPTPDSAWVYPLTARGRLLDNYWQPRAGGPHEALDIFVTREGGPVRSPVSGVVVASGDFWQGSWVRGRRGGLRYQGGGLSRRAGNGMIIFDPSTTTYFYFAHLQPGLTVSTGDLVRAGQELGRVGHTGNAAQPGHGRHLHFAVKRPGTECGHTGVLVSENPYPRIRAALDRLAP